MIEVFDRFRQFLLGGAGGTVPRGRAVHLGPDATMPRATRRVRRHERSPGGGLEELSLPTHGEGTEGVGDQPGLLPGFASSGPSGLDGPPAPEPAWIERDVDPEWVPRIFQFTLD